MLLYSSLLAICSLFSIKNVVVLQFSLPVSNNNYNVSRFANQEFKMNKDSSAASTLEQKNIPKMHFCYLFLTVNIQTLVLISLVYSKMK